MDFTLMRTRFGEKVTEREAKVYLSVVIFLSFVLGIVAFSQYTSFSADEQNYLYAAQMEANGLHAYADYFNNVQKAPGIIWILTPFVWLFGPTFNALLASRVFFLVLKAISTVLIYCLAQRLFKKRSVALAAATLFAFCNLVQDASYSVGTYPPILLLYCLGLYAFFSDWKYKYFYTGLFFGLQVLVRLDAVIAGFVVGCFVLLRSWKNAVQYSFGAIAGVVPLGLYVALNHSWVGFYRAVFVFTRYYPADSQTFVQKILTMAIGARYDLALIVLVFSIVLYWVFVELRKFKLSQVRPENTIVLLSILVGAQFLFILVYPRYAFAHYLNLLIVPLCLISGYMFVSFLRSKHILLHAICAAVACLLVLTTILSTVFPLQPINDRDKVVFEQMQKHPHETIFTAHEQFLFLFDRTEPIYIGKNNHDAYRKSKLDEVLYSPDLSELNSNPAKYDIIYLTDYSEVHISLEQYRKICVPPKQRSLIFYIGDLVTSLHLQKILSTPKDLSAFEHCATWYYVRA